MPKHPLFWLLAAIILLGVVVVVHDLPILFDQLRELRH